MSDTVKRLFLSGKMPVNQLERAVTKGWVSREEADRLLGMRQEEADG